MDLTEHEKLDRAANALLAHAEACDEQLRHADSLMVAVGARLLVEHAPEQSAVGLAEPEELDGVAVYEVALLNAFDDDIFSIFVAADHGLADNLHARISDAPRALAGAVVDAVIDVLEHP